MEHRCGVRTPAGLIVNFRRPGDPPTAGRMLNISSSGALVHSTTRLPLNSFVFVQFSSARNPVPAEVVRTTREGFAVEWVEFSPEEVRLTMRSLAGFRQDPERPAGHDAR
jgi:hypothetical protein